MLNKPLAISRNIILAFIIFTTSIDTVKAQNSFIAYDFFYADLKNYPHNISNDTLRSFIVFDDIDSNVKYTNSKSLSKKDSEKIHKNRNLEKIKDNITVRFGYTNRAVNMKMLPTSSTLHKGDLRFDSNQYHRLGASSPVAVLHLSKDKKYLYVQADIMRGWVDTAAVSIYSNEAFKDTIEKQTLMVVKDNSSIAGYKYQLGDKLPIDSETEKSYIVITPNGVDAEIAKSDSYIKTPLMFNEKNALLILNQLLGTPYDWGGKNGNRDCSALTRDLFLPFGVELPRNTSMQMQLGKTIADKVESKEQFFKILDSAKPLRTLIFFKGHVMIYAGKSNDDYTIYHAVNKLQNDKGQSVEFYKVVKNKLVDEKFTDIWKRVVKIIEI